MSTIISGDTGIDKIAPGAIEFADLPTGSVLQVVTGSTNTAVTVASTSFTDTTLTATITPKFATSKILILISQVYFVTRLSNANGHGVQILRNSTSIFAQDSSYLGGYIEVSSSTNSQIGGREFLQYLDSPASTSAVTYSTQGKSDTALNSGQVRYQNGGSTSVITLLEIAA